MITDSIWYHEAQGFDDEVDEGAEVIVVGGGLFGLLAAYHLHKAGIKPAVIEARRIGAGTSGHTTGKITAQHGLIYQELIKRFGEEKARQYVSANERAIANYIDLIESEAIDCDLTTMPARIFAEEKRSLQALNDEEKAAKALGIDARVVSSILGEALEFEGQAMFQPYDFLIGLARKLQEQGISITEGERVIEYDEKDDHCLLETEKKTYWPRYVVLATLAPINEKTYYSLRIKPIQHHGLAFESKSDLDAMYLKLESPTISFRRYQGYTIAIGASVQLGEASPDAFAGLEREARRRLDLGKATHRWSAHDLVSIDKMPLVGNVSPSSRRIFAATGFRAWGITQSMVSAKIVTNLIQGDRDGQRNTDNLYDPWRLKGAARDLFQQTGHVAKKLLKAEQRCTHMGCALDWNEIEQTYDCSCHGSRFDKEGKVISGPATKPLN